MEIIGRKIEREERQKGRNIFKKKEKRKKDRKEERQKGRREKIEMKIERIGREKKENITEESQK